MLPSTGQQVQFYISYWSEISLIYSDIYHKRTNGVFLTGQKRNVNFVTKRKQKDNISLLFRTILYYSSMT